MNQALLDKIEKAHLREKPLDFNVGDTVRVHTKVAEGDKERIQVFAGLVIARRGHGMNESFTVRRISYGEGVERVFPVNSPLVNKVEIERRGSVRRAKLTYLRDRVGKSALAVKEKEVRGKREATSTRQRARRRKAKAEAAKAAREAKAAETKEPAKAAETTA